MKPKRSNFRAYTLETSCDCPSEGWVTKPAPPRILNLRSGLTARFRRTGGDPEVARKVLINGEIDNLLFGVVVFVSAICGR